MKKIINLLLIVCVLLTSAGFTAAPQVHDKVTVAVAILSMTDEWVRMQDYLANYLGKELNIDFIFSSAISSTEQYVEFIENSVAAGATGLLDFAGGSSINAEAIDALCGEYNIPYVSWSAGSYAALENASGKLAGGVGSDAELLKEASYQWSKDIFTGEGELNLAIFSVVAFMGNAQQFPATVGALNAINENYKLGLSDEEISALALSQDNVEWSNEDKTVNLGILPGAPGMIGDWDANGTILENGAYDTILITGDVYSYFFETIDRYEEMINRDFSIYTLAAVTDAIEAGFNTQDKFGNQKIESTLMKTGSAGVFGLALLLNAMYEDNDVLGTNVIFPLCYAPVTSAEAYESCKLIDSDEAHYTVTLDEFKSMVKFYNPDLTFDELYQKVAEWSAVSSVIERRGIN